MRDLLIRYLLGELDERAQQQLEERLRTSPDLRRELAHLQACFSAAERGEPRPAEPPSGLAERTTQRITGLGGGYDELHGSDPYETRFDPTRVLSAVVEPPSAMATWSLADLTIAAGVCLSIGMLMLPALRDSRDASRRVHCQNNLRATGVLLANYSTDHGGYYPRVGMDQNAGIFAVRLVDEGYISSQELAKLLECRGAVLATSNSGRLVVRIPTFDELHAMTPTELAAANRNMSRMYAYRFGYRVGDKYHHVRDERSPHSPIMADAPDDDLYGSPNHGGDIIQVLYADGRVETQRAPALPNSDDNLFRNAEGLEAAGVGPWDIVLGRSEAKPSIQPVVYGRTPR